MNTAMFFRYLLLMAGVTYLLRVIPFVLIRKKIQNRFLQSFLFYVPYAVLGAMTIPAIFYATASFWSALAGLLIACVLAYREKNMVTVALSACAVVYVVELILRFTGAITL